MTAPIETNTSKTVKTIHTDIVIVGTGVAGLFTALQLPKERQIVMITKADLESSDSYLAQGGICVLRDEHDYDSFMEDTLKAGHYENRTESVDIMIRESRQIIDELIAYGVRFHTEQDSDGNNTLAYTREGGHSKARILYYEDITGQEITSKLLRAVKARSNVTLYQYTTMTDLIVADNFCRGIIAENNNGERIEIRAAHTVLATGGIGGLYEHSTNFPHLTGDAIALAKKYNIDTQHLDYVQIHPTTLYSTKPGRRFLISESLRGEGAVLLNSKGERFTDEIQPRDVVTKAIRAEMAKEGSDHVWLSAVNIPKEELLSHFPNIYEHCLQEGYDITKEPIPVVPAQHYFMGGIWVDSDASRTSMQHLYAVGETSCNGVHGANRLASNSLLESLVFARRAANAIQKESEQ